MSKRPRNFGLFQHNKLRTIIEPFSEQRKFILHLFYQSATHIFNNQADVTFLLFLKDSQHKKRFKKLISDVTDECYNDTLLKKKEIRKPEAKRGRKLLDLRSKTLKF
jgi:hypothetical protein